MRQTFKSIGSNSELREIEQGSAPGPALQKNAGPQQTQLNLKFADLSNEEKIVLTTLWRHQKKLFPDNSQFWTFLVFHDQPGYPTYIRGLLALNVKGYATVSGDRGQAVLTADGIAFCSENDGYIEKWSEYFNKFA